MRDDPSDLPHAAVPAADDRFPRHMRGRIILCLAALPWLILAALIAWWC